MKTNFNNDSFFGVSDENGDVFFCPMNSAGKIRPDMNECIGEDVLGRYAGNLTIVHAPREYNQG